MRKLKRVIRKCGGGFIQQFIIRLLTIFNLNNLFILFSNKLAEPNKVNINYWSDVKNVGDVISPIVVNNVANKIGIDISKKVDSTKHLYAIGSIITAGCQDCTIWGSGLLNTKILIRLKNRQFDIRAVRGPLTRIILQDYGYEVPEAYGDPAVLMPLFYNPDVNKKYKIGVITHMNEGVVMSEKIHRINVVTDNYKQFIDEIKACELVISSSLHGIILSEVYGVPAVLLRPRMDLFKYYDYYYSTNRWSFPIADNIDEGIEMQPPEIPDFTHMQSSLLNSFPRDLWD